MLADSLKATKEALHACVHRCPGDQGSNDPLYMHAAITSRTARSPSSRDSHGTSSSSTSNSGSISTSTASSTATNTSPATSDCSGSTGCSSFTFLNLPETALLVVSSKLSTNQRLRLARQVLQQGASYQLQLKVAAQHRVAPPATVPAADDPPKGSTATFLAASSALLAEAVAEAGLRAAAADLVISSIQHCAMKMPLSNHSLPLLASLPSLGYLTLLAPTDKHGLVAPSSAAVSLPAGLTALAVYGQRPADYISKWDRFSFKIQRAVVLLEQLPGLKQLNFTDFDCSVWMRQDDEPLTQAPLSAHRTDQVDSLPSATGVHVLPCQQLPTSEASSCFAPAKDLEEAIAEHALPPPPLWLRSSPHAQLFSSSGFPTAASQHSSSPSLSAAPCLAYLALLDLATNFPDPSPEQLACLSQLTSLRDLDISYGMYPFWDWHTRRKHVHSVYSVPPPEAAWPFCSCHAS